MPTCSADLLGPTGPFATGFESYEAREGQLAMARAVERTLLEDRVLFCEAGTGTGKTLAYLVPALASGRKVVVSTATRALQDQIVTSDLPVVRRTLGLDVPVAVMKGLSNYLCRRRFAELRGTDGASPSPLLARVERWLDATETGDLSELSGVDESEPLLEKISSSSDTRVGPRCPHHETCFVTRMKRDAESARLVIVNHHLFFADLALRGPHPARVLPDYDAVVFDEAHRLEDVATTFFATRVSTSRVHSVLADARRAFLAADLADPLFGGGAALLDAVRRRSDEFFAAVAASAGGEESRATVHADTWQGEVGAGYLALDAALEAAAAFGDDARGRVAESDRRGRAGLADAVEQASRRFGRLRDDLAQIVDGAGGRVAWFERSARTATLTSAPVDVSRVFRERVFEAVSAVVLTSATLTSTPCEREVDRSGGERASPNFDFLRRRLGVADDGVLVDEVVVPSPFDFEASAVLYVPRDLPLPGDARFLPAAIERTIELVELTDGGAFVLTTSLRSLRAVHAALRARLSNRPVLVQGSLPKRELLARVRGDGRAVLVATMSFWEGVDVVGDALRLVVIEKVPFPVPTDPLTVARAALLEAEGRNPFLEHHVPAAAILLKQGFGRLIRSKSDRGIVALLDGRVHQRSYGPSLLAALPAARLVDDMAPVRDFWSNVASGAMPDPRRPVTAPIVEL